MERTELLALIAARTTAAIDAVPTIADLVEGDLYRFDPAADASLLATLDAQRAAIAGWLGEVLSDRGPGDDESFGHDPARVLARRFSRWLLRRNPYLELDDRGRARLVEAFRRTLGPIRFALETSAPLDRVLTESARMVRAELTEWMRATFGPRPPVDVTCAGYSVGLQRRVLGLEDARSLLGPVLDLGCGPTGALVEALRAEGLDVEGIDRDLEVDAPYLHDADWMATRLEAERYGTIVSHQGFSLHFLHAHLRSDEAARAYAEKLMELLAALRPGGRLIYAPGLPFIERVLPRPWSVARRPLPEELLATLGGETTERFGEDVMYATVVTRIGPAQLR